MICRSAVKPVFIGLGTAAILATGGASALADATPSPSGSTSTSPSPSGSEAASSSPTPTTTPPTPGKLEVSVIPIATEADPGERIQVNTHVTAVGGEVTDIKVTKIEVTPTTATLGGECLPPFKSAGGCLLGDLADGKRDTVISTLNIDKGIKKTVKVALTVTVSAAGLDDVVTKPVTVTYVVPKPTHKPSKPKPSPSPSATKSSSGTSGSSSSGGSGSGGGSTSGGTSGYVPPSPNSSFDPQNPQVALPPIQAPSPSVAPSSVPGSVTPQSRLQGNKAPVAQDITFERMASTQIAWLAALLVAFSLLLTQLRLGKRRVPAGAAAKRPKGSHRRPRRGMFGK
ncbi:hypothetical protein [Actinomadura bangladeshensis]|uniref:DUF11 domain-containing protein n=1 Tax=Actinomadura bangladeshensis TaxID=453573 RepID=A0A6L9QFF3_9ACTN|nr:hypothetical protein [Actinomadura bangladeshensis]NEA24219.1 hypothetical protein [Actinomadura bangladeshensis]